MPSISDLLNTSPGAGSMSPRRAGNLPPLSDLFGITPEVINAAPQRMRNIPPPPVKPKWDIRSGLPEPGLEQVTPEEWLPPGAGGFPAIESGNVKIFSLRTPSGKPAVTVEVVRDPGGVYRISQIKGHANSKPKPEYSQMIEDLKRQFEQQ